MRAVTVACAGLVCAAVAACVGNVGGDDDGASEKTNAAGNEIAVAGMRRLSVEEYERTVHDLLGVTADDAREVLPVDTLVPFDNDYTLQTPSEALVKGAELLAGDLSMLVIADPTLRSKATGCEPASAAADDTCFRSFVEHFGRRALRRPLSPDEIEAFTALSQFGTDAGDFWVGVGAALRAFLQHPEFLYRVEIGTPVDGSPDVHALDNWEVASRLSFFLLGTTPPDWLLDTAASGSLGTKEGVAAAASKLLEEPGARANVDRFHAMWLSYSSLNDDGLAGQMQAETNALIERVVFDEKRPWTDILTSTETYVTPELAAHYGLPSPGTSAGWVPYGDSGRKGILGQGTFLSAVAKFGDTSPTQRGLLVRSRLLCQSIKKPPPELQVNVDMPPPNVDANACKKQRYYMADDPSCSSCHKLMDPIGFGLEAFDAAGVFRTTEANRPECPIDGNGEVAGVGSFNGPGQLADMLLETGQLEQCVARQLYRFAAGRNELDQDDEAIVERLANAAKKDGGLRIDSFILEYVSSDAFRFRRDEVIQ